MSRAIDDSAYRRRDHLLMSRRERTLIARAKHPAHTHTRRVNRRDTSLCRHKVLCSVHDIRLPLDDGSYREPENGEGRNC